MKTEKQITKSLESRWLRSGEKLLAVLGGEDSRGHVGVTVGSRTFAPYPASQQFPEIKTDVALGPITAVVREGRFHGDEWVHDPAVRAWARADSEDQSAVGCAGALAAVGAEGWFVTTDRRVAVVVPADAVADSENDRASEQETDHEAPEQASGGGFGRLLGRARSVVSAVSDIADNLTSSAGVLVLWEMGMGDTDRRLVSLGRSVRGYGFSRQVFEDGSKIEVRTDLRWD